VEGKARWLRSENRIPNRAPLPQEGIHVQFALLLPACLPSSKEEEQYSVILNVYFFFEQVLNVYLGTILGLAEM
jgi:hypothetical protein